MIQQINSQRIDEAYIDFDHRDPSNPGPDIEMFSYGEYAARMVCRHPSRTRRSTHLLSALEFYSTIDCITALSKSRSSCRFGLSV
jgi:hypothetical protein